MTVTIRPAVPGDEDAILSMVIALAVYEREPDAVVTTPEVLRQQLASERPPFEARIVEVDGAPVGFALFFPTYSTFLARPGLYLEDLFVHPHLRGHGVGLALMRHLAGLAVARGYGRFEWSVLDWNAPAIGFYRRLGAVPMDGWTVQRLAGDALRALAGDVDV